MTSKIVEVLTKILEAINKNKTLEEVGKNLKKSKEYDEKIINVAFALLYDKIILNKSSDVLENDSKSFRIFSDEEIEIIGIDNQNYLIHLLNLGLIDRINLEKILYQITLFPELKISKNDINWMIILSLMENNNNLLPGSRFLLNSSDIVN
ncbi:MAG: DUF494 domain-containing protein [Melioribacteraceae bacterium]|nr:DUF494 domain-containing protein [Melioribacteraceae bacterium]